MSTESNNVTSKPNTQHFVINDEDDDGDTIDLFKDDKVQEESKHAGNTAYNDPLSKAINERDNETFDENDEGSSDEDKPKPKPLISKTRVAPVKLNEPNLQELIIKGNRIENIQMEGILSNWKIVVMARKEVKNSSMIKNFISSFEDRIICLVNLNQ